jgi:hypothetical protein
MMRVTVGKGKIKDQLCSGLMCLFLQQLDHLGVTFAPSIIQGALPFVGLNADVGSSLEQRVDNVAVTILCCNHNRSRASIVLRVHIHILQDQPKF